MGLTISGVAVDASALTRGSISHVNALTSDPDQLSFLLNAGTPMPELGAEVEYTLPGGTLVFAGRVVNFPETPKGFRSMGYAVTCADWRSDADRRILNDRFVSLKPGAIVVALFAKYAPEFDTSDVDTTGGPTIAAIRFGRNVRLTGALDRLAALTGFVWDITPDKGVVWREPATALAPFDLTDTSRNFTDLAIEYDRSELANRITVRGGKYQHSIATVDPFDGDGFKSLFRLSKVPFTNDQYVVFEDGFGSLDLTKWVHTDVSNPSPPAGHVSADGYLFTTIQQGSALVESGFLQIVGGNGTWGNVRMQSFDPIGRGDGARRFEIDIYAETTSGEGRCGLWDPSNQSALAGEAYGVFFDDGTIRASVAGSNTGSTLTYTAGSWTRVRIVPGVTTGAVIQAQTGADFQTRNWTILATVATGALENFTFSAIFNKNFNGRADRAKVFNRLLDATLTVGGVDKTIGLYGVDEDAGVDALVRTTPGEPPLLVFFGDTIPATGVGNVVLTYYEGIPVLVRVQDDDSIAAIAAMEGTDGIYEGYVDDPTLDSLELARARGTQELERVGNPVVTATYKTNTVMDPLAVSLRSGQIQRITLTGAASGRDIDRELLIMQVACRPAGNSAGGIVHEFTVTAGSRLKGIQDYILDLLKLAKRGDEAEDPNEVIEELVFQSDALDFTDSATFSLGYPGPYRYGGTLALESGAGTDALLAENGDTLLTENAAEYGMATYA